MSIILFLLCLTIIKSQCPNGEVTKNECVSPWILEKTKDGKCEGNIDWCESIDDWEICVEDGCQWTQKMGKCVVQKSIDSLDDNSDSSKDNSDSVNDKSDSANDKSDSVNDNSDSVNDNSDNANDNSDSANDNSDSAKDNTDSANNKSQTIIYRTIIISVVIAMLYFLLIIIIFIL